MALRLIAKGKWRQVSSDALKEFSDLISIEELTDYEIIRENEPSVKKTKSSRNEGEKKKKRESDGEDETGMQKKRKEKKKRKKGRETESCDMELPKKKLRTEDEVEVDDKEETNENPESASAKKDGRKKKKRNKKKRKKAKLAGVTPSTEQEQDKSNSCYNVKDEPERISEGEQEKKSNKKKGEKSSSTNARQKVEEQKENKKSFTDMSKWDGLFVPDIILNNLAELGFSVPTLVQERCLPVAIKGNVDIIAAAETGSGKTLAFGIPLIDRILNCRKVALEEAENSHMATKSLEEKEEEKEFGQDEEVDQDGTETEEDVETGDADDEDGCYGDKESEAENGGEETSEVEDEDDEDDDDEEDAENNKDDADDNEEMDVLIESDEVEASGADPEDAAVEVKAGNKYDEDEASENKGTTAQDNRPLYALILTPTRELAFQIRDHLRSISKDTDIKCQVLVGGMSIQKQCRLLDQCPEIVVATPGRLWDIFKQGNRHLSKMKYIRCLVIDEADRMVEKFHFEQLSSILAELNQKESSKDYRQTFILSATLTYVPPRPQRVKFAKKNFHEMTPKEKLESLSSQIGIRGKPKIIDLTPKQRTASKLTETRLNFTAVEEKDLHLYCFLKEYPGRTIVFANSLDCVWRLMRLFTLLKMAPLRLFADMQQKQRLKSLEVFKTNPNGLLLATDVAARGLDIAGVDHVIHYEVPRTTESYVHRSGRTARANSEGFSILFIGPKEVGNYRKLMRALDRDDLPVFPMNDGMLWAAKERVTLARKVELKEYNTQKGKQKKLEEIAVDAGMEVEDDRSSDEDEEFRKAAERRALEREKKELQYLLSQPLISKSTHTKYPTKSGQMVWPYLEATGRRAIEMSRMKAVVVGRKYKKATKREKRK